MLPILAPPLLLSLTLHEYAHARAALAFGDATARQQGRVTLNPLAHLDPIGTAMLFIVGFGWARPVPINPMNLHPRRTGEIVVALAGVTTNFLLAVICGLGLLAFQRWMGADAYREFFYTWQAMPTLTFLDETGTTGMIFIMLLHALAVNVLLAIFNLIPLFPLDGHHVVRELLPPDDSQRFMQWQVRYGQIALLALVFGPALLSRITGRYVPSPLSFVYSHAREYAFELFHLYPG
jgi:Zn-dependent protease